MTKKYVVRVYKEGRTTTITPTRNVSFREKVFARKEEALAYFEKRKGKLGIVEVYTREYQNQ